MKKLLLATILLTISLLSFSQNNNCPFKYGATEKDSLQCVYEISAFRVYYEQQKNYVEAFKPWKYVVDNCPCSWNGVYSYAQVMFDNLIENETDSLKKENYINELIRTYETRHLYHPTKYSEGSGIGFKASVLMRYRAKDTYEEAYNLFVKSVDMEKEDTQPFIWNIFFKTAEIMVKQKKDTTYVIEAYERATEYIDVAIIEAQKRYEKQLPNLENLEDAFSKELITKLEYDKRHKTLSGDTARQVKLINNYKKTLSNIEIAFTPYAPCPVLEEVYSKKLETNSNNVNVLKKIVLTMSSKDSCVKSPVFERALLALHKLEPSAQTADKMGNFSLRNGKYQDALNFFKQAIEMYETNEQKVKPYYMMGLTYQLMDDYSASRTAAYEALKLKPSYGPAYILIGDLYHSSGYKCSGGDQLPLAYNWAAADKYSKAAAVDPSCAEQAAAKRSQLSFPSNEEKFKRGIKAGEAYRVGCWIQETTTVR